MSFFSIPDGSGPLADIFASLTFETVSYYVVSWLYYIFHSAWFQWLVYAAFVSLAIWVILNLIPAFKGSGDMSVDD